jgi:hypothetical protein
LEESSMDEENKTTVTLEVSLEELKLIKDGLDLLLMVESDHEAIAELKELLERMAGQPSVVAR